MTNPTLPGETADALIDPKAYGEWDGLHDKLARARAETPLAVAESEGFDPFWAVTRHADILEVSRNNSRFASGIRPTVLTNRAGEEIARAATPNNDGHLVRSLVQMDAPDHMRYRLLTQQWFMPKNLRTIEARIREIARGTVEAMLATGGECDFARRRRLLPAACHHEHPRRAREGRAAHADADAAAVRPDRSRTQSRPR